MAEIDKDMLELKKEVVEARNLVIKTDNLLKNLHADLKLVAKKQDTFERRSHVTSATAYILFMAVSSLGAYMYARSEIRSTSEELAQARTARTAADASLLDAKNAEAEAKAESGKALELFDRLSSTEPEKRNRAIEDVATLQPKKLTALEVRALRDRAHSLRQQAANDALESGRSSFNRRDFRAAADEFKRHITLSPDKPDSIALLLLGQARHQLREYKDAVEPLQQFLSENPGSKTADYVTLILGESLAESGDTKKAIEVYRTGADKYYTSQFAPWMRTRARKLEQAGKEQPPAPPAAAPAAAAPAAAPATAGTGQ